MLFTSGSTGRPEVRDGRARRHAQPHSRQARRSRRRAGRRASRRTGRPASTCRSGNGSARLMAGARAIVIPDVVARDPAALADAIAAPGVTVLEMVPSLLTLLVDEARKRRGEPDAARRLCAGSSRPARRCRRNCAAAGSRSSPHAPLMNTYGHTECSDDEVHWKIYEPPADDDVRVPVGRPIGNLRTYVLDADFAARAPGRDRRRLHGRRRRRPRLPRTAGADRRGVRAGSVRRRARGAPLPHGRSRPVARGRLPRLSRTRRLAGQARRQPHRAGRDRGRAPAARRGRRRRGDHPSDQPGAERLIAYVVERDDRRRCRSRAA